MPLIDTHELLPELAHMHATSATWRAIHAERDALDEADYEAPAIACKAPRRAITLACEGMAEAVEALMLAAEE